MARKAAEFDQFQIRLPGGMRESIKIEADKNGRSMNAELVARIEQSFEISKLQEQVAFSGARLQATMDAFKLTVEILAQATGKSDEVFPLISEAIRTLVPERRHELDDARAIAIESMAKALRTDAPNEGVED